MQGIKSINVLKETIKSNEKVWLLLYKKGSEKSDCAFTNFSQTKTSDNSVLCHADVHETKDIHPEFKITSVPTLLQFENGNLKNIIKGCHQPEQLKAIFEQSVFVQKTSENGVQQKNVVVYTTPTCSWCTTVKRHLEANGVRYREINVAADENAAQEMVRKSGQQGVPQTDINGEIIVGFDKNRINTLLGLN